jgi:hypothetical protein
MKQIQEYEKDIASIRMMMERSAKFISLSGLSGVMAGCYALSGTVAMYSILRPEISLFNYRIHDTPESATISKLVGIAALVLIASVGTALWLSRKKAKKHGTHLWTPATRHLLINLAVPLVSGGVFILIMIYSGYFALAAPASLIFYGIALIQSSANTYDEIRYLGFCQLILGLVCALVPGYGLFFWAMGFGVLHIFYGAIMYNKYDK